MYDLVEGQLVECTWLDPAAASSWVDASSVDKLWKFECYSVGYVHKVDSDGLILTACYGLDLDGDKSLLLRQHIPWICITDLYILTTKG